jgi:hypothetical protein
MHQQARGIDQNMSLLATDFLWDRCSAPFSALFTLWLSMMQRVRVHCLALGGVDLTSPAGRMTMGVIISVARCLPIAYSHANPR